MLHSEGTFFCNIIILAIWARGKFLPIDMLVYLTIHCDDFTAIVRGTRRLIGQLRCTTEHRDRRFKPLAPRDRLHDLIMVLGFFLFIRNYMTATLYVEDNPIFNKTMHVSVLLVEL